MTPFPDNFAKVDGRVWRGGAPDSDQATMLAVNGVTTVINLEWEASDAAAFAGLGHVDLVRIKDFEPLPWIMPSLADDHVVHALRVIRAFPPLVYVHCRSGENRTGVIVAAYRLIELGDTIDPVLADFASYRGLWAWGDERYIRTVASRRGWFKDRLNRLQEAGLCGAAGKG
jgi:hypothetical protein